MCGRGNSSRRVTGRERLRREEGFNRTLVVKSLFSYWSTSCKET